MYFICFPFTLYVYTVLSRLEIRKNKLPTILSINSYKLKYVIILIMMLILLQLLLLLMMIFDDELFSFFLFWLESSLEK